MKKSLFGALALFGLLGGALADENAADTNASVGASETGAAAVLGEFSNLNNSNLKLQTPRILQTPVLRLFELGVAEGAADELASVGRENIALSTRDENGTLAMYLVAPQGGERRVVLELYADAAAAKAHEAGAGYALYKGVAARAVSEAREFELAPKFIAERADLSEILARSWGAAAYWQFELKRDNFAPFSRALNAEIKRAAGADEGGASAIYAFTLKNEPLKWKIFWIYADEAAMRAGESGAEFGEFLKRAEPTIEKSSRDEMSVEAAGAKGGARFDIFR